MTDSEHKELTELLVELKKTINCQTKRIVEANRKILIRLLEIYLGDS